MENLSNIMVDEVNFIDQMFYWPTPGGMGYQLCYIGVRHAEGWYQCFTRDGKTGFFLHEQDLIKVGPMPPHFFKIIEVSEEAAKMLEKLRDQGKKGGTEN